MTEGVAMNPSISSVVQFRILASPHPLADGCLNTTVRIGGGNAVKIEVMMKRSVMLGGGGGREWGWDNNYYSLLKVCYSRLCYNNNIIIPAGISIKNIPCTFTLRMFNARDACPEINSDICGVTVTGHR